MTYQNEADEVLATIRFHQLQATIAASQGRTKDEKFHEMQVDHYAKKLGA